MWTKDNDLLLNTDKTTCTLLTPDAEYNTQLGLQIDNTTLPMTTHPKILGLTLDPKLTYNRHIDLAATKARKTINILKVLTSTKWGKHKETILATYKAITKNTALRIVTGCTHDTNTYTTRLTYYQYTNTYNFTHHKSDRKHNTQHTHYTN